MRRGAEKYLELVASQDNIYIRMCLYIPLHIRDL